MEPVVKTKNVGRIEAVLRSIIGIIILIFSFSIDGILRWVVGLIGVVFILTAIFGYWPWKGFMLKVFSKKDEKKEVTEEKITVTAYSGYQGEQTPREIILHGNKVEVVEIANAWIEKRAGYKAIKRVFEVKGNDGSIHKIHYDEDKKEWFYEVVPRR